MIALTLGDVAVATVFFVGMACGALIFAMLMVVIALCEK